MKNISLILSFILIFQSAGAQNSLEVSGELDTNTILIGQPAYLIIKASHPAGEKIIFPVFKDTLSEKIEILSIEKTDSIYSADSLVLTEIQKIKITGFDSGYFVIKPLQIKYAGDSNLMAETEALLFNVATIPVDTASAIKDIKPPLDVPITWQEFIPYIAGGLALLVLIYFLYKWWKKRQRIIIKPEIIVPTESAFEWAMKQLDLLNQSRLWQNDKLKEYYIQLSEITRIYLDKQFQINAQEFTSAEILSALKHRINFEEMQKLKQILLLADLVKFAKEIPSGSENELSYSNAMAFVQSTGNNSVKEKEEVLHA